MVFGVDPVFDKQSSRDAYKAAVSPEEWRLATKNKINEVVGKILGSDDPNGTFNKMNKEAPGYFKGFMTDQQIDYLDGVSGESKAKLSYLKDDLKGLADLREDLMGKSRRSGDVGNDPIVRSTDKPMPDNSYRAKALFTGSVASAGTLGILAHYHPMIATAIAGVEAIGFGPEILGRLYLNFPEVRSMLLDAGSAQSHIEAVKSGAKIASFLEAKTDEIQNYKQQTGENKKPMPVSLKKFDEVLKETPKKVLTPRQTSGILSADDLNKEEDSLRDPNYYKSHPMGLEQEANGEVFQKADE